MGSMSNVLSSDLIILIMFIDSQTGSLKNSLVHTKEPRGSLGIPWFHAMLLRLRLCGREICRMQLQSCSNDLIEFFVYAHFARLNSDDLTHQYATFIHSS